MDMDFNELCYVLRSDYEEEAPAFNGDNDDLEGCCKWLICHFFED